jgi:hypothetical protein
MWRQIFDGKSNHIKVPGLALSGVPAHKFRVRTIFSTRIIGNQFCLQNRFANGISAVGGLQGGDVAAEAANPKQ